jgi:hypothetical protein
LASLSRKRIGPPAKKSQNLTIPLSRDTSALQVRALLASVRRARVVSKAVVVTIGVGTATTQLFQELSRAVGATTAMSNTAQLWQKPLLFKAVVVTKLRTKASRAVEATIRTCLENSRAGAATTPNFPAPIKAVTDITAAMGTMAVMATMAEVDTTKVRLQSHRYRRHKLPL